MNEKVQTGQVNTIIIRFRHRSSSWKTSHYLDDIIGLGSLSVIRT